MKHRKKVLNMILYDFFRSTGMSQAEFRRRCGITRSVLSRILQTQRDVPLDIAIKIEKGTEGAINSLDLALENHPADRIYMESQKAPKKKDRNYHDEE